MLVQMTRKNIYLHESEEKLPPIIYKTRYTASHSNSCTRNISFTGILILNKFNDNINLLTHIDLRLSR